MVFEYLGGVYRWQNAKFVARVLHSVSRSAILTEDQTEHGSLTLERLKQLLTEHLKQSVFAAVVSALIL